jgi:hypothetical protein
MESVNSSLCQADNIQFISDLRLDSAIYTASRVRLLGSAIVGVNMSKKQNDYHNELVDEIEKHNGIESCNLVSRNQDTGDYKYLVRFNENHSRDGIKRIMKSYREHIRDKYSVANPNELVKVYDSSDSIVEIDDRHERIVHFDH